VLAGQRAENLYVLVDARWAESPGCELDDDRNLNSFAVSRDALSILRCDSVDAGWLIRKGITFLGNAK